MSYATLKKCNDIPSSILDKGARESKKPTSMAPGVFGPHIWAYLHISTRHMPENINPAIIPHIINTIHAIPLMVPCENCALHSGNFITSTKSKLASLKTGSEFFNYTVDFHNFVNQRLGKRIITYEEAKERWA
jgi:FAD-linked sulfhydryl oxidase